MVTGQPEAERPEAVDSSCKERADKRADPSPTQHKTAQSRHVSANNHDVLQGVEFFEVRLIQKESEAGINTGYCSELG